MQSTEILQCAIFFCLFHNIVAVVTVVVVFPFA